MRTDRSRRVVCAAVAAGLIATLTGCAHGRPPGSRFVTGSPGPVGPLPATRAPDPWLTSHEAEVREQTLTRAAERRKSAPPTVEGTDPALRAALAGLAAGPGVASHYAVAIEYMRLGIYDQALKHLESTIRLEPRAGFAWDLRARVWRDWGLPGRALPDAYRATAYMPLDAAPHNTLATILAAVGQPEAARRELLAALRIDPGAAWARDNWCRLSLSGDGAEGAPVTCGPTQVMESPGVTSPRTKAAPR